VGAVFALDSGVDAETAAAIAWHHGGPSYAESPTPEAACVQLADIIVNMMNGSETPGPMLEAALDRLRLNYGDVSELAVDALPSNDSYEASSLNYHIFRLEREANTDELTGIPNRRSITKTLEEALTDRQRGAVLICDIDHFKEINDTLGHGVGDAVLVEVAKLLSRYGLVGRLGGDEFVIWAAKGNGPALAQTIVADASKYMLNGTQMPLSISVGATRLADSVSATFAAADEALYRDKVEHHKSLDDPRAEETGRHGAVAPGGAEHDDADDADDADDDHEGPSDHDAATAHTRRGSRAFEVRDERMTFKALVLRPEVRDDDLNLRSSTPVAAAG
jgi:diguanylate cyclase (GGDEF)-like protein